MKSKKALRGVAIAVVLQLGVLAGSAQTNLYGYTGYETNITLAAGACIITAYGGLGGTNRSDMKPSPDSEYAVMRDPFTVWRNDRIYTARQRYWCR
jgi:hypothetical protein